MDQVDRIYRHQQTPMDETLQTISPHHWLEDFRYILDGEARGISQEIQIVRLEDRLETRYAAHLIPHAYNSLCYSYSWMVRSWDYLLEVGMVRMDSGRYVIENSLIYALHRLTADVPTPMLPSIPELDPYKLVKIAQRIIDAEKNNQPAPEE